MGLSGRQSSESQASELQARAAELERQIVSLPAGSIAKKTVNGREYHYRRWTQDGRRHEKYVPAAEVDALRAQIEQRKALEQELKAIKRQMPKAGAPKAGAPGTVLRVATPGAATSGGMASGASASDDSAFTTVVRTGETLRAFSAPVRSYRKRACYQHLRDFVLGAPQDGSEARGSGEPEDFGTTQDKVLVLYGLRRTGKTTLIRQVLGEMTDEELSRAAFVQITARDTLANVNRDLRALEARGFRYVFLDEVTLMEDFVEGAALFSDVFATCGMRIVLSGTDSLGFLFAEDEQLYDRCVLLHTTFIPYREFERVLGISGVDEYIRYGGTMSLGGVRYNETSTFASKESADEYVDTAIARNIQHSLRCYQHEGHFRHLRDLYDAGELTSAINRVVEDINHRFTLEVLTRDWRSHDLGVSAANLRRDRANPTDILDRIDLPSVTERLRQLLEIRNRDEQTVALDGVHAAEIKGYLDLLDLTHDIDVLHLPDLGARSSRTVIAQPGLRYAQAKALIESLLLDETFGALSLAERTAVQERILSEVRGRMLEDIVLLETQLANPGRRVFVLQFPVGEFDMVVFDPEAGSCRIFEIKHSAEVAPQQRRHLTDPEKCAQTEHRFGPITGRFVLYRGEDLPEPVEGVHYQNVEGYLREVAGQNLVSELADGRASGESEGWVPAEEAETNGEKQ